MVTVKADNDRRLQIPGIKPGQVLSVEDFGNGIRVLTELDSLEKEPFPEGSLANISTRKKTRKKWRF